MGQRGSAPGAPPAAGSHASAATTTATDAPADAADRSFDLRDALHPRVLAMLFLGFSSGLPLLLIFATLSLWLREAGVERGAVTFFSWAALGYSFKFVWAPLIDRLPLPGLTTRLGQRRGWLLAAQLGVTSAILLMGSCDPATSAGLKAMAASAVLLGFTAATQDIVIDAYRIEAVASRVQALMSASYIAGYRLGMVTAGALALYLAAGFGTTLSDYRYEAWRWTYYLMAAAMVVGLTTTLVIREPLRRGESPYFRETLDYVRFLGLFVLFVATLIALFVGLGEPLAALGAAGRLAAFLAEALRLMLALAGGLGVVVLAVRLGLAPAPMIRDTYLAPVTDFFRRYGRAALVILLLIGFYRVSDVVLGVIANVFYQDMGFSKETIATATKLFGIVMTILGGFLGGVLTLKWGVIRTLMLGAALTVLTNLAFILLAAAPGDVRLLYLVISADNLTAGLASAAFVAYLSSLTSLQFTAMQYALFSSLMLLVPKLLGGYSGQIVEALGYPVFFFGASLIGLPVLVLVALAGRNVR